jgi:hypothetical protein
VTVAATDVCECCADIQYRAAAEGVLPASRRMAGDAPAGKLKIGRADGSIQNPTRGCTILQERKWRVSAILVEVRGKNGERMKRLNVKRRKILLADEHHQTSVLKHDDSQLGR